jgi:hypothetical protein
MVSALPNLPSVNFELPKIRLNSSKDADDGARTSDRPSKPLDKFNTSKEYALPKHQSRDGDTLELRSAHPDKTSAAGTGETETVDPEKQAWKDVQAWAVQMKAELKQQQLELLKTLLNPNSQKEDASSSKPLVIPVPTDGNISEVKPETDAPLVPEYWNAENTSNRIVRMATGFAKISGLDPRAFAEKINAAVEEGFSSAHDATGDLPGAAGQLNKDTHSLVQAKLKKWLDDWETSAYNQTT